VILCVLCGKLQLFKLITVSKSKTQKITNSLWHLVLFVGIPEHIDPLNPEQK
jgi:hypothetical protein